MTDKQYLQHLDSIQWKHYSQMPTFYVELRSNTHLVHSIHNCEKIKDGVWLVLNCDTSEFEDRYFNFPCCPHCMNEGQMNYYKNRLKKDLQELKEIDEDIENGRDCMVCDCNCNDE